MPIYLKLGALTKVNNSMKSLLFSLCILLFATSNVSAQKVDVNWLTPEQADELSTEDPSKKIFVYVYTSWCGFCKLLEKDYFTDKELVTYINDNFYPVRFNAEQKKAVDFDGFSYEYIDGQPRGVNQFAYDLLQGQLAYPGLVLLESDKDLINSFTGVQPKQLFAQYLEYVTTDAYLTEDWFEYSGQEVE